MTNKKYKIIILFLSSIIIILFFLLLNKKEKKLYLKNAKLTVMASQNEEVVFLSTKKHKISLAIQNNQIKNIVNQFYEGEVRATLDNNADGFPDYAVNSKGKRIVLDKLNSVWKSNVTN